MFRVKPVLTVIITRARIGRIHLTRLYFIFKELGPIRRYAQMKSNDQNRIMIDCTKYTGARPPLKNPNLLGRALDQEKQFINRFSKISLSRKP